RAAEGEVVVESSLIKKAKLDSLISTATTTITSETVPTAATEAAVSTMGGGKSVNGNSNGKAPFERNSPDIDEDLHSRQLAVYGRETMKR
ncbi:hypothetical protein Q8G46_27865, partial [Klebsiella pneumoniae]|uniref:hypothetical protein n=1 Tax=Klebsiella pneumoniae TaxID=573 RepID=UPI003013D4E9